MATNVDGMGSVVAQHYNKLQEKGKEQRKDSRIYFMRNFNNWIKSTLIQEYIEKIRDRHEDPGYKINVLDIGKFLLSLLHSPRATKYIYTYYLGCGKGGDLLKWQRSNVSHVVGVDIAGTSIEQCKERYKDMSHKGRGRLFRGEFYAADCTKTRIQDLYSDRDIQFDLVSCQFAFHYCFESVGQAECMLRNISENLQKGGYFIGTTPNSDDIMARLQAAGGRSFGNKVFSVTFPPDTGTTSQPPLFGAEYTFHLEEVVDCPEFLVHFPTFVKLAEKFGLLMVGKERFQNYFNKKLKGPGKSLLNKMNALESYPSSKLVGGEDQYDHAQETLQTENIEQFGTLTKDEWEALTIYVIFAFKKMS